MLKRAELHAVLEELYVRHHRRALIAPDPLEAVYWYDENGDREVAGFIAAALAYGRAAQILASVRRVLQPMGSSPRDFLLYGSDAQIAAVAEGFRHRWSDAPEMAALLTGLRSTLRRHGSLEACFIAHQPAGSEDVLPGLAGLTRELRGDSANSLIPDADKGSACKRLHMYMRWMARADDVDPGCWKSVPPRLLIVPLDTHLFRITRAWRMTTRKQADLKAARQITGVFRRMNPDDPVRYDFVLTRFGIRPDMDAAALIEDVRRGGAQSMRSTPIGTSHTMVRSISGNSSAT